jgi:hypothetical protein
MTTPFYSADCAAGSGINLGPALGSVLVQLYTMLAAFLDEDIVHLVKIPKNATSWI